MNLSSARGVANLKVAYSLAPFNQQGNASSHQTGLQRTQSSSSFVSGESLNGIMEKLEMDLEQAFDFRGYQFSLKEGKVRPTLEHLQTLSAIQKLLSGQTCPVQRLMPLIALLTAIAKPVHIGGLPYQAYRVALDKQLEST